MRHGHVDDPPPHSIWHVALSSWKSDSYSGAFSPLLVPIFTRRSTQPPPVAGGYLAGQLGPLVSCHR